MNTLIRDETIENHNVLLPRIVLIACGSFSPPTPMHFRLFEIARDHFEMNGTHEVLGGIVSPTHDAYGKKDLAPAKHRCAMVKLALQSCKWIRASDWELTQTHWMRTKEVLQYHQNYMNNYINSSGLEEHNGVLPSWLPPGLRHRRDPVHLKLLCGADLLESFAVPGLWAEEDIEDIVSNHGLVVLPRCGSDAKTFVSKSDVLTKYQRNITLLTNPVPNEVSSTVIRDLISRGQSVRFLIDDLVLEYIEKNGLFNFKFKYITPHNPTQNIYNLAYIQQNNVTVLSTGHTPPDDDDDADEDSAHADAEQMDEFSLDNRLSANVFCSGDNKRATNVVAKRLFTQKAKRPGQAVRIFTTERSVVSIAKSSKERRSSDEEEQSKAKKQKVTAALQI